MVTIPSAVSDVTAAWVADATGWQVDSIELTDIGTGHGIVSNVYRAQLSGPDCPASAVIKFTATDPAARDTATVLNMYGREVKFFDQLAEHSAFRVPQCYVATISDDASEMAIVMEDLGEFRAADQVAGMSVDDAQRCVEAMAEFHAKWWCQVDGIAESGAALPLGNPMYPQMLPALFADGWAKLRSSEQCNPPSSLHEIGDRFGELIPGLLEQLAQEPTTLLHGDFRADNIMFDRDGAPILIDFQLTHTGSAAFDLGYFITQSIDADTARACEAELVAAYLQRAREAGVPDADLERFGADYDAAALLCLVYPVIGARGVDLDDPRQAALINAMMSRMARAALDHPIDQAA